MFMNIKTSKLTKYVLTAILVVALFLRVYQINQIPPAISWDEAANGYNALAIASYAHDEWGNFLPVVFKSFEDDKNPVHIYITAVFVKILGLSDISLRLPAAVFGTLNVLIIFLLGKKLFRSTLVAFFAAIFLAISPYSLQFSRFSHEATFALFFFMLGLLLFYNSGAVESSAYSGIEKRNFLLAGSFFSFGLSILSYHSGKVVVPPIILLLTLLYWKNLILLKKYFLTGVLLLSLLLSSFIFNPALLGAARIKQTSIPEDLIKKTVAYQNTKNQTLGWLQVVGGRYMSHFSINYLFEEGDKIARHSIRSVGEFYKIDALLILLGLIALVIRRQKSSLVILAWLLLAPIPAAVSGGGGEVPHAARALFMMGSIHILAASGFIFGLSLLKNQRIKIAAISLIFLILVFEFYGYLSNYYGSYSLRYATEWQYGMKQIVEYVKDYPNYSQIYMTDERHQPYVFFLYYLKTPLPEFLNSVYYNGGGSRTYNLVLGFNHYHFGDWDPIESMPNAGVLYIVTPSQYDGLKHKQAFDVKKIVKYPNGENAFFLVSAH